MDTALARWLQSTMRFSFVITCGLLLFAGTARGQATWDFTAGTGASLSLPANLTGGTITAANLASGTLGFNDTSPSSGYPGATGGNNAAVNARSGALSTSTSTYFEVTLSATPNFALRATSLTLSSRGTPTGPTKLTLYSNADNFTTALATATVGANSTWAMITLTEFTVDGPQSGSLTLRVYGSDGSGTSAGNWRIDDLTLSVTAKTNQTISFGALPGRTFGDAPFTVSATATSGLSPTFSVFSGPATILQSTVTVTGAGTVVVRASHAGNSSYNAAPDVNQSFVVTKAAQTISFGALPGVTFGEAPFTVSATASSGLAPSFDILHGPATAAGADGSIITLTGAGTVVVRATQPGNDDYLAAIDVEQSFIVAKAAQVIASFSNPGVHLVTDAPFTVSASGGASGNPVTFSVDSGPASAGGTNGSTITLTGSAGTVTLRAAQASSENYLAAADVTLAFDVLAAAVAPGIGTQPATQTVTVGDNATFTAVATGTAPLSYQWKRGTTNVGTDHATLTLNGVTTALAGAYTVVVTNSAGTITSDVATLAVNPATQTITFNPLGNLFATSAPITLIASANPGNLGVVFSIVSGSAIISGGNTLTLTGAAGTVVVRAAQPGNADYLPAANVDRSFLVTPVPVAPVFTLQPVETTVYVGHGFTLTAEATGVPAPTWQWKKDGAEIPGATFPFHQVAVAAQGDGGAYLVVATNSAGSVSSEPVQVAVVKRAQTIAFETPTGPRPTGTAVTLTATATSTLPVTFTLVSGPGALSGSRLVGTGGTVVIRANQPGNAAFLAATPVDRTFTFGSGGIAPFVSSAPVDQTVNAGAPAVFRASAIGTPAPTYQWQKDGVAIAGATGSAFTLAATTLAAAGLYTVVVSNPAGSVSASATLTVNAAPIVTTSPGDRTIFAGDNTTFTATVTGWPVPTLQWRRNDNAIAGATSATFTLTGARADDAGRYQLVATNAFGSTPSVAATLGVNLHDYSGDYFGQFSAASNGAASESAWTARDHSRTLAAPNPNLATDNLGRFAIHVRADGTGVFLGYLPGAQTGFATLNLRVDASGRFTLAFATLAGGTSAVAASAAPPGRSNPSDPFDLPDPPPTAAAPRPITLIGSLNEFTGAITATIPELSLALEGTRAARTGAASTSAGFYQGSFVGSAAGRSYVIVAPDGTAFALLVNGATLDAADGTLDANGRLALTTAASSTLNLGFAGGALTGTVRDASGVSSGLAGAADGLAGTEHLSNLSSRSFTGPASATLITGFHISGAAKQVLIRAAGPAIAAAPFNVPGTIPDPALRVFRGSTMIAQNDDWNVPTANGVAVGTAATRVGAFPFRAGSADAALLIQLSPGSYTAQVSGDASGRSAGLPSEASAREGVTLAEIYEVTETDESAGARRLVNLSARGAVRPGEPLIAGFVINGTAPQRVLIRGIGPTLAAPPINLPGALANPQLTLFRGAVALSANDDWFHSPHAALIRDTALRVGAFALGTASPDAAILVQLEPGAYTVQLSGAPGAEAEGIALLEIYEAP